jgi:hypothetical protein
MLERMVDKVSRMKPIPPCNNLLDKDWDKVDKLILKTIKAMKNNDVERPLRPLALTLFEMSMQDVIDNGLKTSKALQTVAYRALDTWLIAEEFGRMRQMAVAIRDAARGQEVEIPSPHFPPENPIMIPPSFVGRDVYNDSAAGIVESFADEMRNRGLLPPRKQD